MIFLSQAELYAMTGLRRPSAIRTTEIAWEIEKLQTQEAAA